ncbi:hypothetical protein FGIG_01741 [Fasciola gigantica]|uniref:Uncharacterized protein n=1 Tax=Fasciola gigantica TaxID=46835 RepID=A0A504YTU7_FASGI|nr:hypothetical protein FGIG_01741 [Fasciola gigantica]
MSQLHSGPTNSWQTANLCYNPYSSAANPALTGAPYAVLPMATPFGYSIPATTPVLSMPGDANPASVVPASTMINYHVSASAYPPGLLPFQSSVNYGATPLLCA